MSDLGSIGGGLALGSWALGQNSYAPNTGQITGLALGSWALGQNSYAPNTGQITGLALGLKSAGQTPYAGSTGSAIGIRTGTWAANVINPYLRKPNGGYCSFTLKDVAGGTVIAGARCFIFERSSMISLPQNTSSSGPTPHVSDSNGFVKFTNLEAASDVYYLVLALYPTTGFNAARFDFVQAVLEV